MDMPPTALIAAEKLPAASDPPALLSLGWQYGTDILNCGAIDRVELHSWKRVANAVAVGE